MERKQSAASGKKSTDAAEKYWLGLWGKQSESRAARVGQRTKPVKYGQQLYEYGTSYRLLFLRADGKLVQVFGSPTDHGKQMSQRREDQSPSPNGQGGLLV